MPQASAGKNITDAAQLAPDVVGASEIAANSVGDSEVAAHTTTKITVPTTLLSGTIATAQIADDAVTLDKLAAGTQGGLPIYGASGAPTDLGAGTSGQVLKSQGAGASAAWGAAGGTKVLVDTTQVAFSNTLTETTLATVSVAGGTLGTNGAIKCEIFFANLAIAGAGKTFTIRLKYGATTIASVVLGGSGTIDGLGFARVDAVLAASGATNTQKGTITLQGEQLATSTGGFSAGELATGTGAEDSTAAKTLAITGQFSGTENFSGCTTEMAIFHSIT